MTQPTTTPSRAAYTVNLDAATRARLVEACERRGMTRGKLIERLLARFAEMAPERQDAHLGGYEVSKKEDGK